METTDAKERARIYFMIPPLVREVLGRWDSGTIHGEPGQFVQAVLKNDLTEAVQRADAMSLQGLRHIVTFCTMELPADSWGSPEKYDAWLAKIRRFQAVAFLCARCGHPEDLHRDNPLPVGVVCSAGTCRCRKFEPQHIQGFE